MIEADRIFLEDFTSLSFKNRMMAVQALFQAGTDSRRQAAIYLRHQDPSLTEADADAEAQRTNEGARFQATMYAKIFGEFMGAVEDLGALCFAIRNRVSCGILSRYLKCEAREVAAFFDHVLQKPQEDLGVLLNLPDLAAIQKIVPKPMFDIVASHYTVAPSNIAQVARVYRTPPDATFVQDLSALPPDWPTRAHVMIDAPGPGRAPAAGAIPRVFNKLKHRFMLIGELHKYAALPNKKEYEVVAIATDGTRVRQLMEAVRQASMGAAEIASLIYELDAEGVPV